MKYDYCICTFVNENHESIIENKKTPGTTGVGGRSGARTPDPLIKRHKKGKTYVHNVRKNQGFS